jgi:hypothetical protein
MGTTRDTKDTRKDIMNLAKEEGIQPTRGVGVIKCTTTK